MQVDTLRLLVGWECNLTCEYCCNEQERFRGQFHNVKLGAIAWERYSTICVSGGEPLMPALYGKTIRTLMRIPEDKFIVLYTNGLFVTRPIAEVMWVLNVRAVNVGLHQPNTFKQIITNVQRAFKELNRVSVRFHANEEYREWCEREWPNVEWRFWRMDDCERSNEDRMVLDWGETRPAMERGLVQLPSLA